MDAAVTTPALLTGVSALGGSFTLLPQDEMLSKTELYIHSCVGC